MNKLDEEIGYEGEIWQLCHLPANTSPVKISQERLKTLLAAASAYREILKLAPEIGALVEGYNNIPASMGKRAQERACRFINENHGGFKTLKAIHDNLTVFEKDDGRR